MEKKIIWTIVIGILLFGLMFFLLIDKLPHPSQSLTPQISSNIPPATTVKLISRSTPTTIVQSSLQNPEPQRIYFSGRPMEFPVQQVPPRLDLYGSDTPFKDPRTVTFAYIDGTPVNSNGGITQEFNVPYRLWMLNISVMANIDPTEVWFRIALFHASNGTIIDGGEILNRGSLYKTIQTSNSDMYIIVDAHRIESYRINFETPRENYDQIHNLGLNTDITRF